MKRLPQELGGASPDMAGQDLMALLDALGVSEDSDVVSQMAKSAGSGFEGLLRRRLTPSVKTTESTNPSWAGAMPAYMRGV